MKIKKAGNYEVISGFLIGIIDRFSGSKKRLIIDSPLLNQ